MATTSNSHLLLSVSSAYSVVQKNHFSTAEAQRTQSKELPNEEVV